MARRRPMSRGRGSGLSPARVEWLPLSDLGADNNITLDSALQTEKLELYDFESAAKYADNYGGGDWTVERTLGSIGIASIGTGTKLVKVCFGIGMVQSGTTITVGVDPIDVARPASNPELSWLVQVCCYIKLDELAVERCEFDVKSRRKIAPNAHMFAVWDVNPGLVGTEVVECSFNMRCLIRQKGSRL